MEEEEGEEEEEEEPESPPVTIRQPSATRTFLTQIRGSFELNAAVLRLSSSFNSRPFCMASSHGSTKPSRRRSISTGSQPIFSATLAFTSAIVMESLTSIVKSSCFSVTVLIEVLQ